MDTSDTLLDLPPTHPATSARPALPVPTLSRWQPLRLGLVELFHYDSEEFWFRDGHLLLRGNNGTGKSKVLSLTLPFLLDAQLKPSRIEPDGDAGKKMAWNLLLGKLDRRIGYAWIEFGRINADGQPDYLTLGCGLSAVAARAQVDAWFFVLETRRIGKDLWLTTPTRHVQTKERLKDALQDHGQVFDTATAYRRAVDERLFQLGAARYTALMDTLVQLRQPQLSKKPDEGNLSNALTEALPPMSADLLTDVADALNQLEEYHRELQDYELLAKAVGQFNQRYQRYAATNARRQSRTLRSAQTGYDSASRALNEARTAWQAAQDAESEARNRSEGADATLQASRIQLEQLQSDPTMKDANRLAQAERDARARTDDLSTATRMASEAATRFEREYRALHERNTRLARAEQSLTTVRGGAAAEALASGIGQLWQHNPLAALPSSEVATLNTQSLENARNELRNATAMRREQLVLVQHRIGEVTQAEAAYAHRQNTRDERLDETEAATVRRTEADATVEIEGKRLLEAWQEHFANLVELQLDEQPLSALTQWVGSLQGDNPAHAMLLHAQQRAADMLAQQRAGHLAARATLFDEQVVLEAERERLLQGKDATPPIPYPRSANARTQRAGAPLWQLVDFHQHVGAAERAGLEAALEAAGLLDAWVTPDGRLQTTDGAPLHDTQWLERPRQDASLATWLAPATDAPPTDVGAALLTRLLEGIACAAEDDGRAEGWISPDGRFRLGALAGAWHKPTAAYIGYAARAAARTRRLAEIMLRLQEISEAYQAIDQSLATVAQRQNRAAAEWQGAPSDDALRAAHADAAAIEREFQSARDRLDEAERQLHTAAATLQVCRDTLAADAADLHLPTNTAALDIVRGALTHFVDALHALFQAAHELRLAANELTSQQARNQEAEADVRQCAEQVTERRQQADEARIRLTTLRELIGVQVDELHLRLREARNAVTDGERQSKATGEAWRVAGEARARGEQKMQDADTTLRERTDARQRAITQLQGFAATGLLSAALPDTELPDPLTPWTIEPALNLARRTEQALAHVADDDEAWSRIQSQISHDYGELGRALTALGQQAQADTSDYGMVVSVVYQNRPQRPDQLTAQLDAEITQRRELLTARERTLLENHLQAEIAAEVQRLMQAAERQVDAINKELHKRPTSTGVKFRLLWQPLPEGGAEGAPVGLEAARRRLLNTSTDLWSPEDRRVIGEMLHQRIAAERMRVDATGGSLLDQLAQALDYRRWHRFRVQRWQDGEWRPLSGPASSGERALGLTVPLFAAVSSYYSQGGYAFAPRLVLLDEAFAGIDDAARAHCMGLIHEFDLDFVITSEREWACYAELPGVAICQLQRREGVDAVHVSRWTWDGRARRREDDPDRRFPPE